MRFLLSILFLIITFPVLAETAYERVQRTNEVRCGYGIYAPWIEKDLVTGEMEAVTADFREKYPGAMILPRKPYQTE